MLIHKMSIYKNNSIIDPNSRKIEWKIDNEYRNESLSNANATEFHYIHIQWKYTTPNLLCVLQIFFLGGAVLVNLLSFFFGVLFIIYSARWNTCKLKAIRWNSFKAEMWYKLYIDEQKMCGSETEGWQWSEQKIHIHLMCATLCLCLCVCDRIHFWIWA